MSLLEYYIKTLEHNNFDDFVSVEMETKSQVKELMDYLSKTDLKVLWIMQEQSQAQLMKMLGNNNPTIATSARLTLIDRKLPEFNIQRYLTI